MTITVKSSSSSSNILNGHLGAILTLLYGLSVYKQYIKQSVRATTLATATVQSSESSTNSSQVAQLKTKKSNTGRNCTIPTMPPSSNLMAFYVSLNENIVGFC
ncbi:hypothetical protein LOAG_13720 [Loa loa]|uniref:Uncharacterized protein n=1 Tax=Loa loa TaxID=7209 RepID=A0A1S0TKC3_LOALO|nr:hypothetical protein LOAG_13720 [Loa loa]EFO14793.1 hypothetical protein LOAG_13720 [Loa loa]